MLLVDRIAIGLWLIVTIPLLFIADTPAEALGYAIFVGMYAGGLWLALRICRFMFTGKLA